MNTISRNSNENFNGLAVDSEVYSLDPAIETCRSWRYALGSVQTFHFYMHCDSQPLPCSPLPATLPMVFELF